MVTADEIRSWVTGFDPGEHACWRESRQAVLDLVAETEAPGSRRQFEPGHVTASALVLSDDGAAVLLVFHARLRRWLQPGGHLESADASLVDAARREVAEETGVRVDEAEPVLVGVDVHPIPAVPGEPAHHHHDLMFRFVSPRHAPTPGPGALAARWCPVETLGSVGVDDPLLRAVARARAFHR